MRLQRARKCARNGLDADDWDEIDDKLPEDFTMATVPGRYANMGDLHAGIDDEVFDLERLLEWADRDERDGREEPPGQDG